MTGTIKRLLADKGFGFIASDQGGPDIFFHKSSLENSAIGRLQPGDPVSFEMEPSEKGPRACSVCVR